MINCSLNYPAFLHNKHSAKGKKRAREKKSKQNIRQTNKQTERVGKSSDLVRGPHNIKPVLLEKGHAQIHATSRIISELIC